MKLFFAFIFLFSSLAQAAGPRFDSKFWSGAYVIEKKIIAKVYVYQSRPIIGFISECRSFLEKSSSGWSASCVSGSSYRQKLYIAHLKVKNGQPVLYFKVAEYGDDVLGPYGFILATKLKD